MSTTGWHMIKKPSLIPQPPKPPRSTRKNAPVSTGAKEGDEMFQSTEGACTRPRLNRHTTEQIIAQTHVRTKLFLLIRPSLFQWRINQRRAIKETLFIRPRTKTASGAYADQAMSCSCCIFATQPRSASKCTVLAKLNLRPRTIGFEDEASCTAPQATACCGMAFQ